MKNHNIRIFDVFASVVLIILLSPLMLTVLFPVIIFIGYPPIYISKRVGKDGALFNHYKFKSMLPGKEIGRIFFEQDRLNWWGKFIRKYHFDELPELFLILSGKMSFVGPRPLLPELLKNLDTSKRELVVPGLTSLAQIKLYRQGYINKNVQIRLDNFYVRKRNLKYNLKIICATIICLIKGKDIDLRSDLTEDRKSFKLNNSLATKSLRHKVKKNNRSQG